MRMKRISLYKKILVVHLCICTLGSYKSQISTAKLGSQQAIIVDCPGTSHMGYDIFSWMNMSTLRLSLTRSSGLDEQSFANGYYGLHFHFCFHRASHIQDTLVIMAQAFGNSNYGESLRSPFEFIIIVFHLSCESLCLPSSSSIQLLDERMGEMFSVSSHLFINVLSTNGNNNVSTGALSELYYLGGKWQLNKKACDYLPALDHYCLKSFTNRNFQGERIKVTDQAVHGHAFSYFVANGINITQFTGQFPYSYVMDFREMLNFTIDAVPGKSWLDVDHNGNFTGQALQIASGEADLSISKSVLDPVRMKYFTFLQPFYVQKQYVFFHQPSFSEFQDIYIAPFSSFAWGTIALFIFLILILLYASLKFMGTKSAATNLGELVLFGISLLIPQGVSLKEIERIKSGNVIIICSLWFGFLIFSIYSAAIVAQFQIEKSPIGSLEDLLRNKYIIVSLQGVDLARSIVLDKSLAEYFMFYADQSLGDSTDRLRAALLPSRKRIGFLLDEIRFNGFSRDTFGSMWYRICETTSKVIAGNTLSKSGMVIRKGSPYREFLNQKLIRLMETGLHKKYMHSYMINMTTRCQKKVHHYKMLSISKVATPFIIISFGLALSAMLLGVEKVTLLFESLCFRN